MGALKPVVESEPRSSVSPGETVQYLVGRTFHSFLKDVNKDVVIVFYDPNNTKS